MVEGLVLTQRVANSSVSRVEKAKIGLIQFCLSPPKTDVSHLINIIMLDFILRGIRLRCGLYHLYKRDKENVFNVSKIT